MSWDPPSAGPSATPEPGSAAAVAALGAPLLDALEQHLPGARRHAEATAELAHGIATRMALGRERAELMREAARLHDVGMVYVPAAVLRKGPAELTAADRKMLDGHIDAGSRLAAGAGIPAEVCAWILHTRERWDGGGPAGLAGAEIPVGSRVIRVACAADLMLAGAAPAATVAGLRAAAGSELDPRVVEAVAGLVEPPVGG